MDRAEAEQEELSEWVVIQTSPKSPRVDASTPQNSPIIQPSNRRENPTDDDDAEDKDEDEDERSVIPVVGEDGESSSTVNHSLPWRMIETAKKRVKESGFLRCAYVTRRRVCWSLTLIGVLSLLSSVVYVKLVRWWRQLHGEKLRFLLLLLKEKDQKIKELMVEIGRLNELLPSRRRVRVVRIL